MVHSKSSLLLFECFFFFLIDVGYCDGVKLTGLPISLCRFSPEHVLVHLNFLIVVLKVAVCHYVVVSLLRHQDSFASGPLYSLNWVRLL
jgi:hypothetical protein